jgi:hypothetical protein
MDMDRGRMVADSQTARRVVATFTDYRQAQRAVDFLSDREFPVQRLAIVAEGIRFVEQVTGRVGYAQAALQGAASGAVVGFFFGFIFGLFDWVDPIISAFLVALYGLVFGAIVGAIMGVIGLALSGGQRDFSSVSGMQADHYNVMADAEVAAEAERLLGDMPRAQTSQGMSTS